MKPKAVFAVVVASAGLVAACGSSFQRRRTMSGLLRRRTWDAHRPAELPTVPGRPAAPRSSPRRTPQKAKALIGNDNHRATSLTAVARAE